jgi:hypothetical protein
LNANGQARSFQRRNEAVVIALFRLDRNDLTRVTNPFGKVQGEESNIGPDVDHQRPVWYEIAEPFDRAGFEVNTCRWDKSPERRG